MIESVSETQLNDIEVNAMIHSPQHQEYSARYGLKNASDNLEAAQQIAEAKYRSLVGRDIFISEISGIHQLIDELRNWTKGSIAASHQSRGTH